MIHSERIIILDFGAQYTQLIARRVRECGVYAEILPFNTPFEKLLHPLPTGIILSGGPASVYAQGAPQLDTRVLDLNVPVLGICYGLQLIAYNCGGEVERSEHREFGRAELSVDVADGLFQGLDNQLTVWMSHGDSIHRLPRGFSVIAHTSNAPIAAIANPERRIYGVQFHPEVHHTPRGVDILRNFVFNICGAAGGWNASAFIQAAVEDIQAAVGTDRVICGLSGGVDSSVAAALIHRAIGDQLLCIHIDNGVMRHDESRQVVELFREKLHIPLDFVDASMLFLERLAGITDPEKKRKVIGGTFIEVFEEEARKFSDARWLAQGTLYPDVIESVSATGGPSVTIKSHHNVGGLPEKMHLKLLEPFRELFKDEVRAVGRELGLPEEFIVRHPFPGPGLAVRVLGEVTRQRCDVLRQADKIFIEELFRSGQYDQIWQAFAVLLPVQSVGVMGDERTYENVCALRAVTSTDGMTADWGRLPYDVLALVSNRIINEVRGINRVVYDISSKPPATIEWE